MKPAYLSLAVLVALVAAMGIARQNSNAQSPDSGNAEKTLRILLVAGGCCHDYAAQTHLLKEGLEKRLPATVDIHYNEDKSTKATFSIYESEDWAKDFDVVIHDECSADVTDKPYVERILKAHRDGTPAIALHCGMHSYRWGDFREPVAAGADNAGWFEFLGLQSSGHGPQSPIDITFVDRDHPITKGLKDWTTINEELYNNIQLFPGAHPIASGRQMQLPRQGKGKAKTVDPDAKPVEANAVVAWTNLYGPNQTRVFATTIGHNNETVGDDRYLDLIANGIRWVTGKD
jgi:type 1 glutamine amidotransferase